MHLLEGLDTLIVQDLVMTKTAEMADVVFPASNASFESEGTVTNSERRVQRVRKALDPPGEAKDDIWIIAQLARAARGRLGRPHAGGGLGRDALALADARVMSWERLSRSSAGSSGRARGASRRRSSCTSGCGGSTIPSGRAQGAVLRRDRRPPVDELNEEYPMRLTTGRRLESYNTGVQSGLHLAAASAGRPIDLSPEDAAELGVVGANGAGVSRRGEVEAPVHVDARFAPGSRS